jgi:hypothetical protein
MFRQDISQIEKSTVEMELKYFGWLLLESYKGVTTWRI